MSTLYEEIIKELDKYFIVSEGIYLKTKNGLEINTEPLEINSDIDKKIINEFKFNSEIKKINNISGYNNFVDTILIGESSDVGYILNISVLDKSVFKTTLLIDDYDFCKPDKAEKLILKELNLLKKNYTNIIYYILKSIYEQSKYSIYEKSKYSIYEHQNKKRNNEVVSTTVPIF